MGIPPSRHLLHSLLDELLSAQSHPAAVGSGRASRSYCSQMPDSMSISSILLPQDGTVAM
jgi:hypothetical protein